MKEDAQWVKQTIAGDEQGFHRLIIKYQSAIYRLVLFRVENYDDAQELTQEVFLKAYQKLDSLRKSDQFYPWLRQIAENQCQDWQRKRRAPYLLPMPADSASQMMPADESLLLRETLAKVMEAINELPEMERDLLKERYLDGDSYTKLQERHRLSYGAVSMRLHRAKQRVRERIKKVRAGVAVLPWRDAKEMSILRGGLEFMKLSIKAKLIAAGVMVLSGIGIVTWYTMDKPLSRKYQTTITADQATGQADTSTAKAASLTDEGTAGEESEIFQKGIEEVITFLDELDQAENSSDIIGGKEPTNSAKNKELSPELKQKVEQYAKLAAILPQLREIKQRVGKLCEESNNYAKRYRSLRGTPDEISWDEYSAFIAQNDPKIRAGIEEEKIYYAKIDDMFPELQLYEVYYVEIDVEDGADPRDAEQYAFYGMRLLEYFGKKLPWDGKADYLNAEPWDGVSNWRPE